MTDKLHESGLYEAATNSLASDASSDNTWSKMVTASMVYTDVNVFKHELRYRITKLFLLLWPNNIANIINLYLLYWDGELWKKNVRNNFTVS